MWKSPLICKRKERCAERPVCESNQMSPAHMILICVSIITGLSSVWKSKPAMPMISRTLSTKDSPAQSHRLRLCV